ncbi:hypothetical protein [Flavobacterium proteolyticum]|uniref:Uncharacterized protein n=1 Tax=Flavobacterium proteolyticum TaxID=2911683 RepID=A0ABR9WUC4_9FLAO|nr:hypothetical protein [Flavobacterium proteolyticum]MBE9577252.1 hypothetical protein [Flavobacterium proteolyticum]
MENKYKNRKYRFSIAIPILTIIGIGIVTVFSAYYEKKWSFNWSEIRGKIKDSIKIAEIHGISNGVGGNGMSTEKEVNRRRWIMENATDKELLNLIEYPNGTIKAIAYEGLLRRNEFKWKTELTLKAINDTIYRVDYQSGCLSSNRLIGEYLIEDVLMIDERMPVSRNLIKIDFEFNEDDKKKILSSYRRITFDDF